MSELRADTITASDGTSPVTLTKQYTAKSWVNLDGTGTIAITQSGGISSISDNGTGDYSISHTNAFANSGYAVTGSKSYTGSGFVNPNSWWVKVRITDDLTTTSVRVLSGFTLDTSTSLQDSEYNAVVSLGDLA
jgi:hypothetical protein